MGRPSALPTEEKLCLVLSVISSEMTIAQAARTHAAIRLRLTQDAPEEIDERAR